MILVFREWFHIFAIVLNRLVFMFKIGKICLGSFCFKLGIDGKGLAGLGLVKLLWNKKGYYENESLGLA